MKTRKPDYGKHNPNRKPHGKKPWTPEDDEPNFNLISEIDEYGIRKSKSKKYIENEHRRYGYSVDTLRGTATMKQQQQLPNVEKVWRPDSPGSPLNQRNGNGKPDRPKGFKTQQKNRPRPADNGKRRVENGTGNQLVKSAEDRHPDNRKKKQNRKPKPNQVKGIQVPATPGEIRLNKYLSQKGIASRRKADELIESGLVSVNQMVVRELGARINPEKDSIHVNGVPVSGTPDQHFYLVLNKPKDTITTRSDEKNRSIVMDLIEESLRTRVVPVGRLDRDTTGVLLLSNDGDLIHALTHPSFEIPRTYQVRLNKKVLKKDINRILSGVTIDEELMSVSDAGHIAEDKAEVFLTLKEGKNREIRRIFEFLGYEVEKLDRVNFAGITNEGLARGEYRALTREEISYLKSLVRLK